jgi:hypothetical protein
MNIMFGSFPSVFPARKELTHNTHTVLFIHVHTQEGVAIVRLFAKAANLIRKKLASVYKI